MTFDYKRLLDPTPLPFEMGYQRLSSGVLHVAARTDMHGCKGDMLRWWFGSRPSTREYRWWHPVDHISSEWQGGHPGEAVGSMHLVEEHLTHLPSVKLTIQFRDPSEAFGEAAITAAQDAGVLSALLWGNVGFTDSLKVAPDGRVAGSRLIHLARDTDWGMALRSHFLMGFDLPSTGLSPDEVTELVPDLMGPSLLQHCYDEFTFLSRILPSLYAAEAMPRSSVKLPW